MTPTDFLNIAAIVSVFAIGAASPGPATLMIASTAMNRGRPAAVRFSLGVMTGSMIWAILAASGLAVVLQTSATAFALLRTLGGLYLLWLAIKALRKAFLAEPAQGTPLPPQRTPLADYCTGVLLHLTNPKAPLVWLATLSVGTGLQATADFLVATILACNLASIIIFVGYALLFSTPAAMGWYQRSSRMIDGVSGAFFGVAGLKILTLRSTV